MKCPYCDGTGTLTQEHTHVGALVLAARHSKGLTQLELSQDCGLSRAQIANLETGRTDIPVKTLMRIAKALGVSASELVP